VAVIGSLFTVIGNIYVQIHAMDHVEDDGTADVTAMWGFLLPAFDMTLASLTLYLQFDFTKTLYSKMCTKFDLLFLEICGDLLDNDISAKQQKLARRDQTDRSHRTERTDRSGTGATAPKQRGVALTIDTTKRPVETPRRASKPPPSAETPVAGHSQTGSTEIRNLMASKFRARTAKSHGAEHEPETPRSEGMSPISPTPSASGHAARSSASFKSDQVMGVRSTADGVVRREPMTRHLSAESARSNKSISRTPPPPLSPVDSMAVNPSSTPKGGQQGQYWE